MNVLDLFSGIGGFSLGLERAGMRTVAFCEIEPWRRAVLKKHWPNVPIFPDVRDFRTNSGNWDHWGIDVICGGFPCQDISLAGRGAGIEGKRSGLWSEYARIIGEVRSRFVIVENVAALLGRGLDRVLGDLAALGYDAEWHCISASAVGAFHKRDRIWIIAYSRSKQPESSRVALSRALATELVKATADAHEARLAEWQRQDAGGARSDCWPVDGGSRQWAAEPNVVRVVYGVPKRMDRISALGDAVVPQIPELIGRAIMNAPLFKP